MTDFVERIVEVHDHLDDAEIGHAFGGALALGYIATPRGTVDIDVNCFVPVDEIDRVVPQDWVDLAAIVAARPDLDLEYVEEQVVALRGPTMLARVARLRSLAAD